MGCPLFACSFKHMAPWWTCGGLMCIFRYLHNLAILYSIKIQIIKILIRHVHRAYVPNVVSFGLFLRRRCTFFRMIACLLHTSLNNHANIIGRSNIIFSGSLGPCLHNIDLSENRKHVLLPLAFCLHNSGVFRV